MSPVARPHRLGRREVPTRRRLSSCSASSGDIRATMRSRSSMDPNSTTMRPLDRPRSTFTRVSKRSDSRVASTSSFGATGLLARRGRSRASLAADRDNLLDAAHREPFGHDPVRQPLLGGRVVQPEHARAHGRPRAPRPRSAAAPRAAAAAGAGCSRSVAGSARCGRRAHRGCSRSRSAAGRRPRPPRAG